MGKRISKAIRYFIPLVVLITGLTGLILLTVQQNYRQNANDPQIQIAEDVANALNSGAKPSDLIMQNKLDIAKSLSPFLIIYDDHGAVLTSNAILNNSVPTPPSGVFDFVKSGGTASFGSIKKQIAYSLQGGASEDKFTWQPDTGVRIAAVMSKYNHGYVLVGRSLREVENREDDLNHMVGLAWIVTMGATFIATLIFV